MTGEKRDAMERESGETVKTEGRAHGETQCGRRGGRVCMDLADIFVFVFSDLSAEAPA